MTNKITLFIRPGISDHRLNRKIPNFGDFNEKFFSVFLLKEKRNEWNVCEVFSHF